MSAETIIDSDARGRTIEIAIEEKYQTLASIETDRKRCTEIFVFAMFLPFQQ